MKELEKLDRCLSSTKVVEEFHRLFDNDKGFKKYLIKVLPEIERCSKMEQNNPWHIYNVLDHILHSIEEMNKQTINISSNERRLLSYTMLLHDIGKPECHIIRKEDGKMIDSFFNHNKAGVKIAKRVCPEFGFNEEETKIIEKLVFKHDLFMFIRDFDIPKEHLSHWKKLDYKFIDEQIKEMSSIGDGRKLLLYLILVGRADNLAQNMNINQDTLRIIDKMESMIKEKIN